MNYADYQPATLQKHLESGPLDPLECFSFARQLLAGLASLHRAGMVHRDVKPANCLFIAGELKLADFSLLTEASPLVSRLGTEKYMPPDGRMDARADVYAAGLVIYEMVTGLPADRFPSLGKMGREIVHNPYLSVLIGVALRACESDPQRRYRDAREMLDELKEPDPQNAIRRTRKQRLVIAGLACIAALLFIWAGIWLSRPPWSTSISLIRLKPPYIWTISSRSMPTDVHIERRAQSKACKREHIMLC